MFVSGRAFGRWGEMTLSVGLDVGATNVLGALVDAEGAAVASTTARTPRADQDAMLAVLSSVVAEVSGDAGPERVGPRLLHQTPPVAWHMEGAPTSKMPVRVSRQRS